MTVLNVLAAWSATDPVAVMAMACAGGLAVFRLLIRLMAMAVEAVVAVALLAAVVVWWLLIHSHLPF